MYLDQLINEYRENFNFEKFFKTLTGKKINIYDKPDVAKILEDNLGIDRDNEGSIIDTTINYKKKPYISIEDGSVFEFLDKRIICKPVFLSITKDEQLEDQHSFKVVLLMSFKGKDKNLILTFKYHPSYAEGYSGVLFNIEKIFTQKSSKKTNEELINFIKKDGEFSDGGEKQTGYEYDSFIFIYKSLNFKVKDFVKHIKKGLDREFQRKKEFIEEYFTDGDYDEERDFMVFLLDDKVRIPYALSFDWDEMDDAPDLTHRQAGVGQPDFIFKWPKK